MSEFLTLIAFGLSLLLRLMAVLLILEWLAHQAPGWRFNGVRRVLFQLSYPALKWGDRLIPVHGFGIDWTALVTALVLLALDRFGVPWLMIWGCSLRG